MSTRAKWIACLVAFAVGGLLASIPAFVDRTPKSAPVGTYAWIDGLPLADAGQPIWSGNARAIGVSRDGQRLLANRGRDGNVCFLLGSSGGGCENVGRTEPIQIVGVVTRADRAMWWGIARDDVRSLRVGGSEVDIRHGFGVVADQGEDLVALDADGNALGTTEASSPPIACNPRSCSVVMTFEG